MARRRQQRSRARLLAALIACGLALLAFRDPYGAEAFIYQITSDPSAILRQYAPFAALLIGCVIVFGLTKNKLGLGGHRRAGKPVPFAKRILIRATERRIKAGSVYVLTNPHMPGLCKIGSATRDTTVRAKELDNTSTPSPFAIAWQQRVEFAQQIEIQAHRLLDGRRVRDRREFFQVTVPEAIAAIRRAEEHVLQMASERGIAAN